MFSPVGVKTRRHCLRLWVSKPGVTVFACGCQTPACVESRLLSWYKARERPEAKFRPHGVMCCPNLLPSEGELALGKGANRTFFGRGVLGGIRPCCLRHPTGASSA